jgi:Rrf2 family protein
VIFSASASHALRAIAVLAASGGEEAMAGVDLARKMNVPPHYLAKVLARLARRGVIRARRGAAGGYRLARPASEILLQDVVAPFEGQRAQPGCLLHPGRRCSRTRACSAHAAWSGLNDSYRDFLERTTVGDIVGGV